MCSPTSPSFLLALTLLLVGTVAGPLAATAGEPVPDALRGKLVGPRGTALVQLPGDIASGKKYYALYFSAGWCPPCHTFTPKLVNFYNQTHAQHPEFEVIFISSDNSEEDMRKYMEEYKMPFPALRFDAKANTPKIAAYGGPGIPCLVLVNASGKVLADSFAGQEYRGPDSVMVELQRRLSAGGGS